MYEALRANLPTLPRKRFNIFSGTIGQEDLRCALRNLVRARYDDERVIEAYEHAFAEASDCRHAVSFGAGRMALYAVLEALGIARGDEVVIPAYTCVVVPNAILYRGAVPVYADIDPVTFNIDPAAAEAAITPRTKALYLQHTFGHMADAEAMRRIADRHGLLLIEDCAHSVGGRYEGRRCGSLGDVSFLSTDRYKVINTLLGGMVTSNDDAIAAKVRELQRKTPFLPSGKVRRMMLDTSLEYVLFSPRLLWMGSTLHTALRKAGLFFYFEDEMSTERPRKYPYPCRLSSAQSELGMVQLAALPENLAHRRRIARWMESRVGWFAGMSPEWRDENAWLRYSFLVRDRAEFVRRFRRHFDLGTWFTSVTHGRQTALEKVGYLAGSCPTAEHVARHIVNFPTHPRVDAELLERFWLKHEAAVLDNVLRPEQSPPRR